MYEIKYIENINTKNNNHTASNNNVRFAQNDVGYKNLTFNFMDNM